VTDPESPDDPASPDAALRAADHAEPAVAIATHCVSILFLLHKIETRATREPTRAALAEARSALTLIERGCAGLRRALDGLTDAPAR
jgi:hypothetical protein